MSSQPIPQPDPNTAPTSNVGAVVGGQQPPQTPAPIQATPSDVSAASAGPTPAKPSSRLGAILGAVANVADTALAGIPDKGRSSVVTGLGEGARAEQSAQATQNAIRFKSFDDQVRMSELHNQDIKMQNDNQAQQDAHNAAELNLRKMANDAGIDWATLANHGPAVMDNLAAQTAASGSASVPDLTHVSADGSNIYMPKDPDSQKTRDGVKQMYSELAPAYGLPSLGSVDFVPPKLMNMLTNRVNGFGQDGNPLKHDDLPSWITTTQAKRDYLAKNGGTPAQLKALDNTIGIYKANLDALDTHAAGVADDAAQRKTDQQKQLIDEKADQQRQTNASKPQKPQSTDWVSGVSADEKKKAELAENLTFNANNIASILQRRPDIVGKVAGRITSVEQMTGTNDPDIVQLGTDIHNIAMANNGIHGMRSADAVHDFENKLLNGFKNGPQGIAGGLRGSVNSVQTFIDNARPETYKTHSKQGGAIKAMVPQQ